jgi:hypothetical protein
MWDGMRALEVCPVEAGDEHLAFLVEDEETLFALISLQSSSDM